MEYLMRCVEFDRKPITRERIRGFVLAVSDELTLLNQLDDTFYLNGYTVIRNRDVRKYSIYDDPEYFLVRALKLKGIEPEPQPGISLESWQALLESASKLFPLITIHREKITDKVCHIGRVTSIKEKTFKLKEIDPDAEWIGAYSYKFKDLTRVDFGGGYEDALARVAAEDEERLSSPV